jgi:hypothetical protein
MQKCMCSEYKVSSILFSFNQNWSDSVVKTDKYWISQKSSWWRLVVLELFCKYRRWMIWMSVVGLGGELIGPQQSRAEQINRSRWIKINGSQWIKINRSCEINTGLWMDLKMDWVWVKCTHYNNMIRAVKVFRTPGKYFELNVTLKDQSSHEYGSRMYVQNTFFYKTVWCHDRLCSLWLEFLATDPEVRIVFLRSSGSGTGSTQPRVQLRSYMKKKK